MTHFHPYRKHSGAASAPKTHDVNIMGHFFAFEVESTTDSAMTGKYKKPVHEKITPSWYGMKNPFPTKKRIRDLCEANTDGIFFVGLKYKGKKDDPDDSQPTITGKTKGDESFSEGALREIGEEIGGLCDLSEIEPIISFDKKGIETHTFILRVSQITPLEEVSVKSEAKDNHNRRVEVVLYGTVQEIETALKKIRIRPKEETDIMGIMAYPFEHSK